MKKQSKKITGIIVGIVIATGFGIWGITSIGGVNHSNTAQARSATIYKSPTCGCCTQYIAYLKNRGFDVTVEEMNDLSSIKSQYGIPHNMESCHTMVIDDYVVEGHVPVDAIEQLLTEKPDIDGIALPGMPAGSPGMPGAKHGEFQIYSLDKGQSQSYSSI